MVFVTCKSNDLQLFHCLIASLKAMTHQPTQLLSRVWSGPVGVSVIGLHIFPSFPFFLHSSLIPDCLVGSGPTYDSTVELGWLMCHGLNVQSNFFRVVTAVLGKVWSD